MKEGAERNYGITIQTPIEFEKPTDEDITKIIEAIINRDPINIKIKVVKRKDSNRLGKKSSEEVEAKAAFYAAVHIQEALIAVSKHTGISMETRVQPSQLRSFNIDNKLISVLYNDNNPPPGFKVAPLSDWQINRLREIHTESTSPKVEVQPQQTSQDFHLGPVLDQRIRLPSSNL